MAAGEVEHVCAHAPWRRGCGDDRASLERWGEKRVDGVEQGCAGFADRDDTGFAVAREVVCAVCECEDATVALHAAGHRGRDSAGVESAEEDVAGQVSLPLCVVGLRCDQGRFSSGESPLKL